VSTLKSIASQLGVSTATVSRALNDQPGVSNELRMKVRELAERMDYTPNVAATVLATSKTHTIGYLCTDFGTPFSTDPFYYYIMRGAEREFRRHGYYVLMSTLELDPPPDAGKLNLFRERRVDGLVVVGPAVPSRFILDLLATGAKIVLVDNLLQHSKVNCVVMDDRHGGYTATQHLISHGYAPIACLSGPDAWPSSRSRVSGYLDALKQTGLAPLIIKQPFTTFDTGYLAMRELLAQAPNVRAVFAVNDSMALGAMRAAVETQRSVPGDVAFVGFDDIAPAAMSNPTLTTVHVPKEQFGRQVARRLLDMLSDEDDVALRIVIDTQLVVRASCGCRSCLSPQQETPAPQTRAEGGFVSYVTGGESAKV